MIELTLHRAGRVLEAIRAVVGSIDLTATARVSIFDNPAAELSRKAEGLQAELEKLDRLLEVQSRIRAAVGRANVDRGISDLLARKTAAEEWVKLVSPLVAKPSNRSTAVDFMNRRLGTEPTEATHLASTASAMRARYEASDVDVGTTLETRLLDDDALATLKKQIGERRREVERLSTRLRALNDGTVAIDDVDIEYLTSVDVV